jgi:hypothetical protein
VSSQTPANLDIVHGAGKDMNCADWDDHYHGQMALTCSDGEITVVSNNCQLNDPCDFEEDDCIATATCTHRGPGHHTCECPNNEFGDGKTDATGCTACPDNSHTAEAHEAVELVSDCKCLIGFTAFVVDSGALTDTRVRDITATSDVCTAVPCPEHSAKGENALVDAVSDAQQCKCTPGYFVDTITLVYNVETNLYSNCLQCTDVSYAVSSTIECTEANNSRVGGCEDFYHVLDHHADGTSDTCQLNICTCENGAADPECEIDGSEKCQTCFAGYEVDDLDDATDAPNTGGRRRIQGDVPACVATCDWSTGCPDPAACDTSDCPEKEKIDEYFAAGCTEGGDWPPACVATCDWDDGNCPADCDTAGCPEKEKIDAYFAAGCRDVPPCVAACDWSDGNCPADCDTAGCPEDGEPSQADIDTYLAAGCPEDRDEGGDNCHCAQAACEGAGFTWTTQEGSDEMHCTCDGCTAGRGDEDVQEQAECEALGCEWDEGGDELPACVATCDWSTGCPDPAACDTSDCPEKEKIDEYFAAGCTEGGDWPPACVATCDWDDGNCPADCDTSDCPTVSTDGYDGENPKEGIDAFLAGGCVEGGGDKRDLPACVAGCDWTTGCPDPAECDTAGCPDPEDPNRAQIDAYLASGCTDDSGGGEQFCYTIYPNHTDCGEADGDTGAASFSVVDGDADQCVSAEAGVAWMGILSVKVNGSGALEEIDLDVFSGHGCDTARITNFEVGVSDGLGETPICMENSGMSAKVSICSPADPTSGEAGDVPACVATCDWSKGCPNPAECDTSGCPDPEDPNRAQMDVYLASGCTGLLLASGCFDFEKDGFETDVDCGGLDCGSCLDGFTCKISGDCASGSCYAGLCVSCENGWQDGDGEHAAILSPLPPFLLLTITILPCRDGTRLWRLMQRSLRLWEWRLRVCALQFWRRCCSRRRQALPGC